jgi:hypothetical protein
LTLLARLGLRAGEVAALRLDDLDWHAGEVKIRGKGDRHERLPLPVDVGAAVAAYLQRGRSKDADRSVFVRVKAPRGPLHSKAVRAVVHDACIRAGLAPIGAHRLRHTTATEMLRAGPAPRDRTGPASPSARVHGHLREGRPNGAARPCPAMAWRWAMTGLRAAVQDYLTLRRRLGFALARAGLLLPEFIDYLEEGDATHLTTELAVSWATMPEAAHPAWWRERLGIVRGFASYLKTIDPATEVPAHGLLSAHRPRIRPYLYSADDIVALLEAASALRPPWREATCGRWF